MIYLLNNAMFNGHVGLPATFEIAAKASDESCFSMQVCPRNALIMSIGLPLMLALLVGGFIFSTILGMIQIG